MLCYSNSILREESEILINLNVQNIYIESKLLKYPNWSWLNKLCTYIIEVIKIVFTKSF